MNENLTQSTRSRDSSQQTQSCGRVEMALFALALTVYLLVRLIRLADYPIYFFTDEAVQTVLAQDFLRDHFRGYDGVLFPTFFFNSYQYNLGVSVYLQVLPFVIFGKSVAVTRGVSVGVCLLAGLAVGLSLQRVFRVPHAWAGVLLLSATPAWFLHSRTAFETAEATAFYACFLFFYLIYRSGIPRALYASVVFAALAFYTYNPARMVVITTALLLGAADVRYHWSQHKSVVRALILGVLLAIPFLRFQLQHGSEMVEHLRILNSYWVQNITLAEKIKQFGEQMLHGLNPLYWYLPDEGAPRHVMKGYGHLLRWSLPLGAYGLWLALTRRREPAYRTLLLALLAGPSGGALVEIGVTRVLPVVIPAALLAGIAFSDLLENLVQRIHHRLLPAAGGFILLAGMNFWMLNDALVNGPLWFTDYSMQGVQYGARQVFTAVKEIQAQNSGQRIEITTTWTNGADIVARFFFDDPQPFTMGSIHGYLDEFRPDLAETLFVMTPEELELARNSSKLRRVSVERILPFPNGEPGFYFVRALYADGITDIFAAEKAARRRLLEGVVNLGGQPVLVQYSYLDMGDIQQVFDGDAQTLVRTLEANPLKLQLSFDAPRAVNGMQVRIGGTRTLVRYTLLDAGGETRYSGDLLAVEDPNPRTLALDLPPLSEISTVLLEIKNADEVEPAHVHLWEVTLQ